MSELNSRFFCTRCGLHVQLVVKSAPVFKIDADGDELRYMLGACVTCDSVGLVYDYSDNSNGERSDPMQVYPALARPMDFNLPPKVHESYTEAMRCLAVGAWIATAVMVRRTLEAVGREFDPDSKQLFKGLRSLRDKGVRFLGNIGAHPTDDVIEPQDARESVEFLAAIIETIYFLRPKFQAMRTRREKAPPPPTPILAQV
jgi:hypothetical protein